MTPTPQQADKPYEARGKVEWLLQQQRMRVISGPFFCKVAKGWMARQFLNMWKEGSPLEARRRV